MSHPSRRRLSILSAFALLSLGAVSTARAQQSPPVPSASPPASVSQRVGITDLTARWSSPGVKGRKVFGGLVPYGEVWRTGANQATLLESSTDFTFGKTPVKAGTYALFTIPGESSWTVILSTDTEAWGAFSYDKSHDVARVSVKPEALSTPRERLALVFSDTTDSSVRLDIEWDRVRVGVPLGIDTNALVLAGIDEAVDKAWTPLYVSARYLLESNGDLDRALKLSDESIALKPTWSNTWTRAQILGRKGRKADAIKSAEQAIQLGKGDRVFDGFYKPSVEKAIKGWK